MQEGIPDLKVRLVEGTHFLTSAAKQCTDDRDYISLSMGATYAHFALQRIAFQDIIDLRAAMGFLKVVRTVRMVDIE